jgi:hypothetical protein
MSITDDIGTLYVLTETERTAIVVAMAKDRAPAMTDEIPCERVMQQVQAELTELRLKTRPKLHDPALLRAAE